MNGKIARELRKLSRLVTEKHWTDYIYTERMVSRPWVNEGVPFLTKTRRMVDDCARAKYKFFKQEYKVDPA